MNGVKFWGRVNMNGPTIYEHLGPCWEYSHCIDSDGYGRVFVAGKYQKAHRVAWRLTFGKYPEPCGLHRCDNRLCVRPSHVFEGTQGDNTADRDAKKRTAHQHGMTNGTAKLTDAEVLEIRWLYETGIRVNSLAKQFGISHSIVSEILSGKRWTHL
jgi:hypothetical protein